jgi:hypothetical protein
MKDALLEALKCWIALKSKEMEVKLQATAPVVEEAPVAATPPPEVQDANSPSN